jgi:hypothetical protein
MGIFGKLLGKKKDDLGLDGMGPEAGLGGAGYGEPLASPDMGGMGGYGSPPSMGQPMQPQQQGFSPEAMGFERVPQGASSYSQASPQSVSEITMGKDLEIINAKLDAIKAELDSVNQRLKRIERIAEGEREGPENKDKWNY